MNGREMGALLTALRKERGLTQRQVAERLTVSPQAVSKWERGNGCPDTGLLPGLAALFGVSAERLLEGDLRQEKTDGGNMKRVKFYVCPGCGNLMTATGGGEPCCCGRRLEPLKARLADAAHAAAVREVEEDWLITFDHPMEKDHFLLFGAYVTADRCLLARLYPEQGGELRIPQLRGGGRLYLCCSRDGLFEVSF